LYIKSLINADNAVSDIVGFMLILSIMIVSLAAISLFAQPILNESKDEIYFSNMEQSFTLLHSDTNDIASGRSTIKTRDLNIANAQMNFDPKSTQVIINIPGKMIIFEAGSIEYDIKDSKVCLENGALLSSYGTGSIVVSEPFIYTDGKTTVINLVQLDGPAFSVGGEGIVRITQQKNFTESYVYPDPQNVKITINSQYAGGWAHYLEKQGFNIESSTSNSVTANISGTRPRIYGTNIKISSEKVLPVNPPVNSLSAVITTPSQNITLPNILINVTINNTGNQNFSHVKARLDYFSDYEWENTTTVHDIGDIPADSSKTTNWTVSTFELNNEALFTVTVSGSSSISSWINQSKYQIRSNQISIIRN